jgi:UDP-N-acetylmuramoyl-tripeptide--D-alanyl-D-alanine ligase
MKQWTPQQVAEAAGARLIGPPPTSTGPERVTIDSRAAGPGALFVGLSGANADGGKFAPQALAQNAWGILTAPDHADAARCAPPGVLLAAEDPLRAMQGLATAWRRELNAKVIGVTGSTGKTSTKDLLLALLQPQRRTVASRQNFNTEIGLPLEILAAPAETKVIVLEMGMRGAGQIAELATIAEPDVAVIVSIGPVHLALLGSIEAIAAAKAELIAALPPGGTAIVPAGEALLEAHLRADVHTVTFGEGGDVRLVQANDRQVEIDVAGELITLEVPFTQTHLRLNLLAAVAAAKAVGVTPSGCVDVELSPGRGQRAELPDDVTLIDDCYNANPMSMRAALDDLAATAVRHQGARTVAVLGDMLELGPDEERFHVEIGEYAGAAGVQVLITVGPLARAIAEGFAHPDRVHPTDDAAEAARLVPDLLQSGDVVLVKASRGVGLELVCRSLSAGAPA